MWVQSLGLEDSLEEEMATYSHILAWKIPWTEKKIPWQATFHGAAKNRTRLGTHTLLYINICNILLETKIL